MTKVKIHIKEFLSSEGLGTVAEVAVPNHNEIIKDIFVNSVVDFLIVPKNGDTVLLGDFLDPSQLSDDTKYYFLQQEKNLFTVKECIIRKDYLYVIFERKKTINNFW